MSTCGWLSTSRSKRASALAPMRSRSTLAPEMPWLSTATGAPPPSASRSARWSGQRSLPSTVEPSPSVMELPNRTKRTRVRIGVDQDLAEKDARRHRLGRLEVGLADDVARRRDIGGLPGIVVPGGRRRHIRHEQADGDARQWRDVEVHRIADDRDGRHGRAGLPAKVRAWLVPALMEDRRHGNARRADGQRLIAILVRQDDADALAAQAYRRDLPDRLVHERSRNGNGGEEIRLPNRLRACRPCRDPGPSGAFCAKAEAVAARATNAATRPDFNAGTDRCNVSGIVSSHRFFRHGGCRRALLLGRRR